MASLSKFNKKEEEIEIEIEIEQQQEQEQEDEIMIEEEEIVKCTDAALIRKYLKICSKVRDNLYLGSDMIARDKETLLSNGITQ